MTQAHPHPLAAPLEGIWTLVHGPLAHWARERPEAIALQNETTQWTFAQVHEEVLRRSATLVARQAPAMVLLDAERSTLERLIDFLAIIHSGRCAAVADPDWPEAVRERITGWLPTAACTMNPAAPTSPFYTGFTSGSTGMPKGFMRHHRSWTESFRVSLQDFGAVAARRTLSPGRISHSLFLFGAMQALWNGAGAVVQEKFSASRCLATLAAGEAPCLVAVPSQLLLMLQWAEHRQLEPVPQVELITISGARWMRAHTPALRALFPRARLIEFYGASEASFVAWMEADEPCSPQAVGRPFSNVEIDIRPLAEPSPDQHGEQDGLIYVRSPMLFMDYLGDAHDRTAVLRDGPWLSVRDMGHIDERGMLCLAGRQSRMIVTQGKNLFPEEVENLLLTHPQIAQVSLHGQGDPLRGMQVHAVLHWTAHGHGEARPDAMALTAWVRERLEAFKAPRQWWVCPHWPHTASGKTDHARLGQALAAILAGRSEQDLADAGLPWLQPWKTGTATP
ncbi:AMP-binding protein [Comamonas terrae]|uniref:AMP-binding protein n=1 Tax=Comamonas terrae TaxID=673548 RepID=A0ABW5UQX5_9BURK|nr:AMP-binding protein [Comamonas terrae]